MRLYLLGAFRRVDNIPHQWKVRKSAAHKRRRDGGLFPRMLRFILRRLLVILPTLLVVITIAFFLMRLAPGSPFAQQRLLPPEILENVEAKYGFDRPLIVQYFSYLGDVITGDFGPSLKYMNRSVIELIGEGLAVSAPIGLASLLIALSAGIGLGVLAALNQNRPADYVASTIAVIGICVPTFVTAPLLVLLFAANLGWLPTAGTGAGLRSYILPVFVLALPQVAAIARLTRAGTIEVMNSNFIRTARAKGLTESTIVWKHALRAALLPLVGYLGPAVAFVLTGSLVIDKVFRLSGLGNKFYTAAIQRDYTLVMGIVILSATLVLVFNLIADIVHAWMDPRVRLS
jgi:oligopeptide transport system permease protein